MTVSVTLSVGPWTRIIGTLDADLADRDEAAVAHALIEAIDRGARDAIDRAGSEARAVRDRRRLEPLVPYIRDAVAGYDRESPGLFGPVVGFLRREQGMSLAALARAMGRDPRSVRSWESQRPSRCEAFTDFVRASAGLGYEVLAVYEVVGLMEREPRGPRLVA
ncbi:MAG: hypothetical protein KF809_02780 [Chloroflexi bacterium]|nr:hypothetical protein [Chloroflexota bacterium]